MRAARRYGWQPDLPDRRDYKLGLSKRTTLVPDHVNLRPGFPSVYDQGDTNSCTAQVYAACFEFAARKQSEPSFTPSRLFIYYNERAMENTIEYDSGATLRDGAKTLAQMGVCSESLWPFDVSQMAVKPIAAAYREALQHQTMSYWSVAQSASAIEDCLAAGFPIAFGFTVYESFESEQVAKSGILQLPTQSEGVVGGHAVTLVGYNIQQQRFYVRNSWGPDWGLGGYFTIPYDYVLDDNLADDFWTIRKVE
jgi:C1A family cysteine protease